MTHRVLVALVFSLFAAVPVCHAFFFESVNVVGVTKDTITVARTAKEGITLQADPDWVMNGPDRWTSFRLRFQDVRVGMRVAVQWHKEGGVPTCNGLYLHPPVPAK
jgi:hypothetical protein